MTENPTPNVENLTADEARARRSDLIELLSFNVDAARARVQTGHATAELRAVVDQIDELDFLLNEKSSGVREDALSTSAAPMEVEVKYRISDRTSLLQALAVRGFRLSPAVHQDDQAYAEPGWHYGMSKIGVAFARLRTQGSAHLFTIKRPRENEMACEEHETAIADRNEMHNALLAMGFHPTVRIAKSRQTAMTPEFQLCLDDVENLGTFLELEMMVPPDQSALDAQEFLDSFVATLNCSAERVHETYDSLIRGAASVTPAAPNVAPRFDRMSYVDKSTGVPCPVRGQLLCTITDVEHRHVAEHMDDKTDSDDLITLNRTSKMFRPDKSPRGAMSDEQLAWFRQFADNGNRHSLEDVAAEFGVDLSEPGEDECDEVCGDSIEMLIAALPERWEAEADKHTADREYGLAEGLRIAARELTEVLRSASNASSDMDNLLTLLKRFGVEPWVGPLMRSVVPTGEEVVTLCAKEGGVQGYDGFECQFEFNADGTFHSVGVYE